MLLNVTCNDPGLKSILLIVKRILNFIQLIGPIICIIMLIVVLIQLVNNPDDKKIISKIKNIIIALVMLFFIPTIVDVAMSLADDNFKVSSCWVDAVDEDEEVEYINDKKRDKEKTNILIDPEEYKDK